MDAARQRAWAWRQRGLPPEEKLLLLALIDAADAGDVMRSRPDVDELPPLIEEAAYRAGLGVQGSQNIARRLFIRQLVDGEGRPQIPTEKPA